MPNGIYFTRIAALGTGKPPAEISFKTGLNVVTGASDTGKSYLIDCIDYILGAREEPKKIKQAEGYEKIRAEIRTFDGHTYTLNRQFNDNSIYVAECEFERFDQTGARRLSTYHSEKNDNNISVFLLKLIRMDGKRLKKNNLNETKSLSFRDLAGFCLVSETRIIEKQSPIYSGQKTEETANKSLFKLLLTGEDDDELESIENPELFKSRIKGKIELIKEEMESKQKFLLETKKHSDALTDQEINVQIQKLLDIVEEAHKELSAEENKRALAWSQLDQLKSALSQNEEIKKRFELLNQHYSSDLNRLEFINEGKQGLDQLKEVNCPLCNSLIDQRILEPYTEQVDFLASVRSEFSKIEQKKGELIETIGELNEKIEGLRSDVNDKREEFEKIDKFISDKLKPIHETHAEHLNSFLKLRDEKAQISLVESQVIELKRDLSYYYEKLQEKQERAPEKIMPEQVYSELSNEVKNVFVSWGIECEKIYYDPSTNDIEINGEKRSNSGKGYRAIYLSGFMIAVLLYCLKHNLKHPNFLVLDSPLTQYKERDLGREGGEKEERLPEEIQNRFYESLASLQDINKFQIIVIENKDPPEDVRSKINFVHFSKNEKIGRYGFYPL
ncbi:MAG: hypothetical protein ABR962_02765 [Candidatus Bathyarchaeia archaeon]